jgi:hypothetical protein
MLKLKLQMEEMTMENEQIVREKAEWALGTKDIRFVAMEPGGVIPQGEIVEQIEATDANDSLNTCCVVRVRSGAIHVI